MEAFVRGGGLLRLSTQLKSFVQEKVFPAAPVMLGVDHSATGGVVSALSEELGPENLGIVVIDQHFDCLPISLRVGTGSLVGLSLPGETGVLHGAGNDDEYCCGDFWKYLIDSGVVLPENLMFIGVADYPEKEASPGWETYRENYLRFEKLGCSFFPLREFEGRYAEKLQTFVKENVATPHVYVSLDLDVGSYRCVHAARYMDREGIDRSALMGIARIVGESARAGKFRLAGVDIMEFNVHFLELETPGGTKDETLGVARDFLAELLVGESV
jgi:arginase family enzyme